MITGNKDAERHLLACIVNDNSILDEVSAELKPEDFYGQAHKRIYEAMLKLAKKSTEITHIAIVDVLTLAHKIDDVGFDTVLNLTVPTTAGYKGYIEIIKREAIKRDVQMASMKISELAKTSDDAYELIAETQNIINEIDQRNSKSGSVIAGDIAEGVIEELFKNDKDIVGIKTGFTLLDKMLDGLHKDELIILAARPSMGKTALALNIATNVAKQGKVLFFSLEMAKEEIVKRMLSLYTGLSTDSLKRISKLPDHLQQRVWDAYGKIKESTIEISDDFDQPMAQIRATTRQFKQKHQGIDLIVIDYLQLIKANSKSNREQEVAEISRSLKMLAKEYHVPIITLAQVNRGAEQRNDKKPGLADLRESGAIEQDADVVMFLYREEYYNPTTDRQGQADLIVAKHRAGAVGEIPLYFDKRLTKFGNLELKDG